MFQKERLLSFILMTRQKIIKIIKMTGLFRCVRVHLTSSKEKYVDIVRSESERRENYIPWGERARPFSCG